MLRTHKTVYTLSLFIFGIALLLPTSIYAQNQQVSKANKLYSAKNYGQAIALFLPEVIEAEKPNRGIMTKLANCYRMTNQMEKAEPWYAKVVESDKAKPRMYLYYGEVLMSNGKYDEAKKWLLKYSELTPDDDTGTRLAASCDMVKNIKPMYTIYELEAFEHNSELDEMSPTFYGNEIVFSSDRKQGTKLLKQKSGWTDRDYIKLYSSEQTSDTTFSKPSSFSVKLNELNKNTAGSALWKDTTTNITEIYFTRNGSTASKRKEYNMQLFRAESENNGKSWKKTEVLYFCTNESNYMHPAISPDGKMLFFVSDKGKGQGGTDIYYCTRKEDGTWKRPQNMGATINTDMHDGFPFMNNKKEFFFCSKGHVGYGGFDIFKTTKKDGEWTAPINVGKPINSAADDISICFTEDDTKGAFTSSRDGGDDDIYFFNLAKKIKKPSFVISNIKEKIFPVEKEAVIEEKILEEETEVLEENMDAPTVSLEEEMIETEIEVEEIIEIEDELVTETEIEIVDEEETEEIVLKEEIIEEVETEVETELEVIETENPKLTLEVLPQYLVEEKVEVDQVFRLDNISFQNDEYVVDTTMIQELDKLVKLLHDHPTLQIEVCSHTDSKGDDNENQTLSRYRAEAIASYVKKHAISEMQIGAKGYGETMLLNQCENDVACPESQHAENRRIEVKVLDY